LFNADVKTFILSTLCAAVTAVKTVNSGYSLPGANTLLIGAYVEKVFNLLNQANNLNRIIADNSITESRTNQLSRYFMLSFSWRLQNFGKI